MLEEEELLEEELDELLLEDELELLEEDEDDAELEEGLPPLPALSPPQEARVNISISAKSNRQFFFISIFPFRF